MVWSEFSLIEQFFKQRGMARDDVLLGIGDDAAVTRIPSGMQLVTTTDTLVCNVHFSRDTPPAAIGHKSLAVNLSDLAAMGAEPVWVTLALTLPQVDEAWLQQFCAGFFDLAEQYNVQLIGGDTTQGPLSITVQAMGLVPEGKAILRQGAKAGDLIFVSGTLGEAALGLAICQQRLAAPDLSEDQKRNWLEKLYRPLPRIALGLAIRELATAAIDISDGLAADLNHVLQASHVGATIDADRLPISKDMRLVAGTIDIQQLVLGGGDDYELCFTLPANKQNELQEIARQLSINVVKVGVVEQEPGLRLSQNRKTMPLSPLGFEHFSKQE